MATAGAEEDFVDYEEEDVQQETKADDKTTKK